MARITPLGSGPLAAAAASLAPLATPAPCVTVDPAAFLARLMDLRGSVDLAQRLGAVGGGRAGGPFDRRAAADLRAEVAERLDAIAGDLERTFAEPFQRRNKLPSAPEVHAILVDTGALAARAGGAASRAAEVLWAPFGDLVARVIDRARFELVALRAEMGPRLAAISPAAARIERLDATLFAATERGRQAIEDRLQTALGRAFARSFAAALAALPEGAGVADIGAWFAPRGLLREVMDDGREVAAAVIAHDRRRFEALSAAAAGQAA